MASPNYAGKSAYHGEIALRYDEQRVVEPVWALEQEFVRAWIATRPAGGSLLDIPAGTGRFVPFYRERGLRVQVRDISADMLAEVRRQFPDLPADWTVRPGDAERLDLTDDAMEAVISWRFFHLIPAPVVDRVLGEFRRVCAGPILVQVFAVRPAGAPWTPWLALKARLRPLWHRLGARRAAGSPWAHITSFSHREEDLFAAFARAGLHLHETRTIDEQDGLANRVYLLGRQPRAADAGS